MTLDENKCIYIKQGGFYFNVSGNDALILHKYLGYKLYGIKTCRTGFPVYGQKTVLKKLDKLSINYDLYNQNGELIESKRFPNNKYEIIDQSEYPLESFLISNKKKYTDSNGAKCSKSEFFIKTLQSLSEGVNPYTGEIMSGFDDKLRNDLFEIILYFDKKTKREVERKEKYNNAGQPWSNEEDDQLIEEYNNKISLKEISKIHNRTTGAIKLRLLHLHQIKN